MADRGGSGGRAPGPLCWAEAEFISIVKERLQTDDVQFFVGFVGEPSETAHFRRLYCRPDLTEYVEFNEADAYFWEEKFRLEGFPLEATLVWVRSGSEIRHGWLLGRDAHAEFLEGETVRRIVKPYYEGCCPATLLATTWRCPDRPPTKLC